MCRGYPESRLYVSSVDQRKIHGLGHLEEVLELSIQLILRHAGYLGIEIMLIEAVQA